MAETGGGSARTDRPWRLYDETRKGQSKTSEQPDKDRYKNVRRAKADPKIDQYEAGPEVLAAIDTAVALGKPLLVAGEPGVGKTQLARYIAKRFGLVNDNGEPEVLRFDVKSTTKGADLVYHYDAIRHFRDRNLGGDNVGDKNSEISYRDYIDLSALGQGLAIGRGPWDYSKISKDLDTIVRTTLTKFPNTNKPRISVVLIDEIDKAPRDVPNDLLRELEEMSAPIRELGQDAILVQPDFDFRPIVIITTNDERALPDAFLRRCCFLHIKFPDRPREGHEDSDSVLREIVRKRLGLEWKENNLAGSSIRLIHDCRAEGQNQLSKPPTTAELIDFILELRTQDVPDGTDFLTIDDNEIRKIARRTAKTVLSNSKEDDEKIDNIIPLSSTS